MRIIENKKKKVFYVVSVKTGELKAECLSLKEALKYKHAVKRELI